MRIDKLICTYAQEEVEKNEKSGVKRVHDVASRMRLYGNMIVRNKYPIFKKVYGGSL